MRRGPVPPPREPARWDCRQIGARPETPSTDLRRPCGPSPGSATALLAHAFTMRSLRCSSLHPDLGHLDRRTSRRRISGRAPAWVIIGRLVSFPGLRLDARARAGWAPQIAATFLALWVTMFAATGAFAQAPPPSTWVALTPLPHQGRSAIFALAVDPINNQVLIAGNSQGSLLRSTDGGAAWASVHSGTAVPTTIAFSPFKPGLVLAGTRGGGGLLSGDGGSSWSSSGVADMSIDSIAVAAVHVPIRMFAAADGPRSAGNLPMFQSVDGGANWSPSNPAISGTYIVKLAAGPLPPVGDTRPLVVGTNAGLF